MKFYTIVLIFALSNCGSNKEASADTETRKYSSTSQPEIVRPGCYLMVVDKDSAFMNVNIQGDSVTGTLQYNRFEKDDNTGNFAGIVDSNKVLAWYKFQSEGVITVRQLIFKINGDKLAEGYGDVNASGDTAYFAYPHTLNYEEAHSFQKIACP